MRAAVACLAVTLLPGAARAQAKAGWGNLGKEQPEPSFWTRPLFDGFWMAWTPATLAFFAAIFALTCATKNSTPSSALTPYVKCAGSTSNWPRHTASPGWQMILTLSAGKSGIWFLSCSFWVSP